MRNENRFDALRGRIRRRFSRSRTYSPEIAAGESKLIFDIDDPENVGNDDFLEHGPFNIATVRNFSDKELTVFATSNRKLSVRIPAAPAGGAAESRVLSDIVPPRYLGYLRIRNEHETEDIPEGDVEVQVGNEVDSVELDLLKMGGLLDVMESDIKR